MGGEGKADILDIQCGGEAQATWLRRERCFCVGKKLGGGVEWTGSSLG